MRTLLILLLIVILAAAGWFVWAAWLPVQPGQTTFVLLRPGWSTRHIAHELQRQGVIRNADAFLLLNYAEGLKSLRPASISSTSRPTLWRCGGV